VRKPTKRLRRSASMYVIARQPVFVSFPDWGLAIASAAPTKVPVRAQLEMKWLLQHRRDIRQCNSRGRPVTPFPAPLGPEWLAARPDNEEHWRSDPEGYEMLLARSEAVARGETLLRLPLRFVITIDGAGGLLFPSKDPALAFEFIPGVRSSDAVAALPAGLRKRIPEHPADPVFVSAWEERVRQQGARTQASTEVLLATPANVNAADEYFEAKRPGFPAGDKGLRLFKKQAYADGVDPMLSRLLRTEERAAAIRQRPRGRPRERTHEWWIKAEAQRIKPLKLEERRKELEACGTTRCEVKGLPPRSIAIWIAGVLMERINPDGDRSDVETYVERYRRRERRSRQAGQK
jgi:hypothetical protein